MSACSTSSIGTPLISLGCVHRFQAKLPQFATDGIEGIGASAGSFFSHKAWFADRRIFPEGIFIEAADRPYDDRNSSPRDWIDENVKQLDPPALDMRDVRAGDGHGAIGRARSPEKSCGAVVAHGVSGRGKDKLGR